MPTKIDLSNQKFNHLQVIKESPKRSASGSILWECQCECGNITYATSTDLKSGHKKSCGCFQRKIASELGQKNLIDIVGQKFGQLTVIKKISSKKTKNGSTQIYWLCKCDCGNNYVARGDALKNGNTQSCGCLKSKGEQKINNLLNEYGLSFEREKIFPGSTFRYDFFVNNKYIIEYDGKQHFQDCSWGDDFYSLEQSQKRDNEKNLLCQKLGFPIIRIPYTHFNSLCIEDLLIETSKFKVEEARLLPCTAG